MRKQYGLPLAILLLALGVPSFAQNAEADSEVAVAEGAPLTVRCPLRVAERVAWRLDGAPPPADMAPAGEGAAPGGLTARLAAAAARPHHAGVYTCASPPRARVRVRVRAAGAAETSTEPAAAAAADVTVVGDGPPAVALVYNVSTAVTLNCSAGGAPFVWRKNGTALELLPELKDRYKLDEGGAVLRLPRAYEDDFGEYSCARAGQAPAARWALRARPVAKLQANTNVVEGQRLKLVCRLVGKPYPAVTWWRANSTDEPAEELTPRAGLNLTASEQGVAGAALELAAAERSDAGVYTCVPQGGLSADTTLRVKDMYAALWPFLGICAEVFVLCAIILVYEKRRTKPELDDSDADNNDQKKS